MSCATRSARSRRTGRETCASVLVDTLGPVEFLSSAGSGSVVDPAGPGDPVVAVGAVGAVAFGAPIGRGCSGEHRCGTEPMNPEKEKMLAERPYDPSDPELVRERERARALTRRYNEATDADPSERRALLEELFGSVGSNVTVEPPVRCDYGYNVHAGDGFYANVGCVIVDVCPVTFGDGCLLGPGVHLYTAAHPTDAARRREGVEWGESIVIGENVWIGGRAVVNPGIEIGDDAIVASGAVVTDDVPAKTLVAGNPARAKRELD